MLLKCDHCKRPLARKRIGGKLTWSCRYSHTRRSRAFSTPKMCRKCRREPAGEEGLCYPCRYYRR